VNHFFKKLFSRFTFVALTIILSFIVGALVTLVGFRFLEEFLCGRFPSAEKYIRLTVVVLKWLVVFITAIHICNRDMTPETKAPWLLCVFLLQMLGVFTYVVFSDSRPKRRYRKRFKADHIRMQGLIRSEPIEDARKEQMGEWSSVAEALTFENPVCAVHGGTKTEYLASGEAFFARLLEDLEKAEKFIFIETFIVERGKMWNSILEILERKAAEGVTVRVLYDDIGSMGRVRSGYARSLRKKGIDCRKFNPFVPVVSNIHNNRDHRKITVIDGYIGYTGGINLADEYINEIHPFGKWKDSAVRLEGPAVQNFTLMFLRLYDLTVNKEEDLKPFFPEQKFYETAGYVQPYCDGPKPMYSQSTGENVYLNLINGAKKSLYITTPYLIVDYRLREAIARASHRGVDVRLVMPGIPDKKIAFALTRSNYLKLIQSGVKIYEYSEGFIHAKNFLVDGEVGVVGTINLDYRSLMHHYEDAVLLYGTECLADMERDFEEIFSRSQLQTEESAKKGVVSRVVCEVAKVFAPLF